MPTSFSLSLSGNYKYTFAKHRAWQAGVVCNGESWPRIIGQQIASSSDIYRLGIIPTYALTAPSTTSSGTSTPGTYGVAIVYRTSKFDDGLSGDDIQGNRSNIVDVTLSSSQAAVLTIVTTTDTKVDLIDVYAAQKIGAVYGAFYRVVKDTANSAGTITFNIQMSNTLPIGAEVTNGTADTTSPILVTDNDYPTCQSILIEVNGRLVTLGGITKRVTASLVNASGTVTTTETVYDGIEFWFFKRDSDTTGGVDGRGTYLCRYATANTVTLVNADGTADTYDGSTGSETATIWTPPNRKYSKPLNPHAFPTDNISDDFPSAILAAGKVPNTNRLLIMGKDWVIAEDYDRLPLEEGLNYISTSNGCSSHFSVVSSDNRLYWLDFSKGKRNICTSDGSGVTKISTQKIKSILERVTLDDNGDVWRVGFIHGEYFEDEQTIRWGLYLDGNTVANYILELDLVTGDLRNDPTFYPHRYLDVFTYGKLRGRVYIGQFGWSGGIARIGLDNVAERYYDWVPAGTISGTLATSGQTTTALTIASGTLYASGDLLKGIQALVWQESTAGTTATLVAAPTYYHCRISTNSSTVFTVNYVETVNAIGEVTAVDTALPAAPSGSGWNFRIGVIQGMAGPKWFTKPDARPSGTFRELALNHEGQNLSTNPIKVHFFENLDDQPRDSQYMEPSQQGEQVASTSLSAASFAIPKTNPSAILGFMIVDNNCTTDTTALSIETATLVFNEADQEGDRNT